MRWAFLTLLLFPAQLSAESVLTAEDRAGVFRQTKVLWAAMTVLEKVPPEERYFYRILWFDDKRRESYQAAAMAINGVARFNAPNMNAPIPVPNADAPELALVDLRHHVRYDRSGDRKDFKEFADAWEELRFDPKWSLLLTKGTLKFAGLVVHGEAPKSIGRWERRATAPYTAADGKTYDYELVKVEANVVRADSRHVDQVLWGKLRQWTGSEAPIVSHRYFILRAWQSLQDKGLVKDLYGGLNYQFIGIKRGLGKNGGTDEDVFFRDQLGVGDGTKNSAEKIIANLNSDSRVAMFCSDITKRPRRVKVLPVNNLNVVIGQAFYIFSEDLNAENVDVDNDPIANLDSGEFNAKEGIFRGANGVDRYVLFNGQGALQDFVPENVASLGGRIPAGYRVTFGAGMDCWECHAANGGHQKVPNDILAIARTGIDVFDKRNDRLKSLYGGNLEEPIDGLLPRARRDNARVVLKVTGPWKTANKTQTDIFHAVGKELASIRARERYREVDAKLACEEMGVSAKDNKQAVEKLKVLWPQTGEMVDGVPAEDFRVGGLLAGKSITRVSWDLFFAFGSFRAQETVKKMR